MSSLSSGKCAVERKNSMAGKRASSHSGKWSRSSSQNRSKPDEPGSDLDCAESEFHLASCNLEEKETINTKENSSLSPKEGGYLAKKNVKGSLSGIPLPTTKAQKPKVVARHPTAKAMTPAGRNAVTTKHTLEVQFLNKNKRFVQLKKELVNQQKPVVEMYQSLLQIKKKLGELGKCVKLDDIKFMSFEELMRCEEGDGSMSEGGDAFNNAKLSIEQIPKTLMDVCKNLLSRRSAIVELLETVSKTEIDSVVLEEKVRSLKNEGVELQRSLDAIISDHEKKIEDLVNNWQKLIRKQTDTANNEKVEELEMKLRMQENLLAESQQVVCDLQKKLDDKKSTHDKIISELESVIKKHEEKIKKIESDLEIEKKLNHEHKNRNATSVQTIKSLKNKIGDLESKYKDMESKNAELHKKLSHAQDQTRLKESMWSKEKEELNKNLKNQENLLAKLTADRNHFETRFRTSEEKMSQNEKRLMAKLQEADNDLHAAKKQIEALNVEKLELVKKCEGMELYMKQTSESNRDAMNFVSSKVDWGKSTNCSEAELLSEVLSLKVEIRNYEDKMKTYEEEICHLKEHNTNLQQEVKDAYEKLRVTPADDPICRYQRLLEESERKLNEKCRQISNLQAEIRHLKMRQNAIDEQNENCPTSELMKMVNEGKSKMSDLVRKSMENDQKLHDYELMVEKQQKQMMEMENLLKMRNGLLGVMKSKKDELQLEKESLTRYSNEMRTLLFGIKEDLQQKSEQIQDLTEKLENKERLCSRLEKKISELEDSLAQTNEQRFKLQDTIGLMEKELQSTKAQVHQMTDMQSRYELALKAQNKQLHDPLPLEAYKIGTVNIQPQFMSQALYGMSLKNISNIRARVEELNNLKVPVSRRNSTISDTLTSLSSTSQCLARKSENPFEKVLQLKARRCEILQERADQSHDDLNELLRLLTPAERPNKEPAMKPKNVSARSSYDIIRTPKLHKMFTNVNKMTIPVDVGRPRSCYNMDKRENTSQTLKDLNETINNLKQSLKNVEDKMHSDSFKRT